MVFKIFSNLFIISLCYAQIFIRNVNIGDVENHKIIKKQTVVIEDGIITSISKSSDLDIPKSATIIDATGKFLFPGLTDAHVHFFQSGGLYARPDVINFTKLIPYNNEINSNLKKASQRAQRYLKHGITNVIDVGATYNLLKIRDSLNLDNNKASIYMSGPLLTTYVPTEYENLGNDAPFELIESIDQARNLVLNQLKYKPDFIKIWYILDYKIKSKEKSARIFLAYIEEIIKVAHANNIKVAVHATERISAELAVKSGADYLVHYIEDELISDDFAKLLKKHNVFLSPTLTVNKNYNNVLGQTLDFDYEDFINSDPFDFGSLTDMQHINDSSRINKYIRYYKSEISINRQKKRIDIKSKNLKKLLNFGVKIVTGTDAGNIGTLHATSYSSELLEMSKAGMTNWQIIEASSLNAAKLLSIDHIVGKIKIGMKADLILFEKNPSENIINIKSVIEVFKNGKRFKAKNLAIDSPEALVQRQVNAYNLRNMEAFLEPYSEDIELYDYPNKLSTKGKSMMRKQYTWMFDNLKDLHCEVVNRIKFGNFIIDKERIRVNNKYSEAVAIYEIKDGKIVKAVFIE